METPPSTFTYLHVTECCRAHARYLAVFSYSFFFFVLRDTWQSSVIGTVFIVLRGIIRFGDCPVTTRLDYGDKLVLSHQ